jgi:hypothetical protein
MRASTERPHEVSGWPRLVARPISHIRCIDAPHALPVTGGAPSPNESPTATSWVGLAHVRDSRRVLISYQRATSRAPSGRRRNERDGRPRCLSERFATRSRGSRAPGCAYSLRTSSPPSWWPKWSAMSRVAFEHVPGVPPEVVPGRGVEIDTAQAGRAAHTVPVMRARRGAVVRAAQRREHELGLARQREQAGTCGISERDCH